MIRILLSAVCSIIPTILFLSLYVEYNEYIAFEILGFEKRIMFINVPVDKLMILAVIVLIAIFLFIVFFEYIFKNVPTFKTVLMKLVADSKDIVKAKNSDIDQDK